MAIFGNNVCTPNRVYGPLPQTILCGCSIKSFSASVGWNEQASNVTVELVQDPCVGQKVWWNSSLQRQTGSIADPGFTYPEPGCAVYFRVEEDIDGATEADRGGFEYSGLVEGWTETYDTNGNPVYTLRLTDPRAILENAQIIVNDYPGGVSGVWNMINAYGFLESIGSACSSSPAGGIGGVITGGSGTITNDRGMTWNDLKCSLNVLLSSTSPSLISDDFCRENRLVYTGPTPAQEGYGVIANDATYVDVYGLHYIQGYVLDLTEIPLSSSAYRITGPTISISELISQVCQDAGCDYYIELLPVLIAGQVLKVIKVRVATRSLQPVVGRLGEYILARKAENNNVISYVNGEEVRNEETSVYLMGGKRQDPWIPTTGAVPYWGVDTNNLLVQSKIEGGQFHVKLDITRINNSLVDAFAQPYVWISEAEMRASAMDADSMVLGAAMAQGDLWQHPAISGSSNINTGALSAVLSHTKPPAALFKHVPSVDLGLTGKGSHDKDVIADFIKSYFNEYYGKQFIVKAPFVCKSIDAESKKYRYSHLPSTDGCWINTGVSNIIGLPNNTTGSDLFKDDAGKCSAILRFPVSGAMLLNGSGSYSGDFSALNTSEYLTALSTGLPANETFGWVKAEIKDQWVLSGSDVYAAFTISAPVTAKTSNVPKEFKGNLDAAAKTEDPASTHVDDTITVSLIDRGGMAGAAADNAILPNAILAPILSNVEVYGPWGVAGIPGQVAIESDEGFTPWEYGSTELMNIAALDKVSTATTQMYKGERGTVSLAGFPNLPLGAELSAADAASVPYCLGVQKYAGTRIYSVDSCVGPSPYYYVKMNPWEGLYGPNITNVNINVGPNGFTTEYQFSTFTPRAGRFNKDNAERLKKIGQDRRNAIKNLRAREGLKAGFAKAIDKHKKAVETKIAALASAPAPATTLFLGSVTSSGRPDVGAHSAKGVSYSFADSGTYTGTAMMSVDGLLRPVSKSGDGGLPRYIVADGYCTGAPHMVSQPNPPVDTYTGLPITTTFLDPLSNSGSPTAQRSDEDAGHDIEILGRNATPSTTSWSIPESEDANAGEGYAEDYRFLALKGPVVIQQWGYDLDGKPVPNAIDTEANTAVGTFAKVGLKDKFYKGWLQKPMTWPVAPLDLRLDRRRGVWTTPQPPRNIHISPEDCLATNTAATLVNASNIYDGSGNIVSSGSVTVEWPWTTNPPDNLGTTPAYYDTVDCKYYAFPTNRLDVNGYIDIKKMVFSSTFSLINDPTGPCDNTVNIDVIRTGLVPTISKSPSCENLATSAAAPFTNLNIGSGLRLVNEGGNNWSIHGGIHTNTDNCVQQSGYIEGWQTRLTIGNGLEAETNATCGLNITSPLYAQSSAITGQVMTHDADCNKLTVYPSFLCTSCNVDIADTGPYHMRKSPKYISTIWAGRGIGITSCGDCDLVLFNNHIDVGVTSSSCKPSKVVQVGKHTWSDDFDIVPGPEDGGPVDDADGSLDTKIMINESQGAWSTDYVKSISCLKNGQGYITGLTVECGSMGGTKSCGNKYWLTSVTNAAAGGCGNGC